MSMKFDDIIKKVSSLEMKKVSVAFTNSGHDAFEQDGLSITGSGEVTFKVAIVGVPETYKDASVATVTLQ